MRRRLERTRGAARSKVKESENEERCGKNKIVELDEVKEKNVNM